MQRTRTKPTPRFQMAINQEMERARQRIRKIDLWSAILFTSMAVLAYALVVISLDAVFRFENATRTVLFVGFVGALAGYIVWALVLPLYKRINPKYAARVIEQASPNSKNALMNWMDLEGEPLPRVIRDKMQERAAGVMERTEVERAIPSKRTKRLAFVTAALLIGLFICAFIFAGQLGSLLKRAFVPFVQTDVPTKTRLAVTISTTSGGITNKLVEDDLVSDGAVAENMEVYVLPNYPITIHVRIEGVSPEKVELAMQDSLDESPRFREFRQLHENDRDEWEIKLDHQLVKAEGLWIRAVANDGSSRRYHILHQARPDPRISAVEVKIQPPAYTKKPEKTQFLGPVTAMVGSKLTMVVMADQPIQSGTMNVIVNGVTREKPIALKPDPAAAEHERELRMIAVEPLDVTGEFRNKASYKFALNTPEGRRCVSPEYSITIEDDAPPKVELKQIGKKPLADQDQVVQMAANDIQPILGRAWDEIAVMRTTIELRTSEEKLLRAFGGKPVDGSPDKPLQQAIGRAQTDWANYQLILDLTKVTDDPANPKPTPLVFKAGQSLLLRVVAYDNCEPEANVAYTRTIKIELTDPLSDQQRKENEQKADQPPPEQDPEKDPNKDNKENKEGQGKGEGEKKDDEPKGEGKPEGKPNPDEKPGECKDCKDPAQGDGQGKNEGKPEKPQDGAGQGKPQDQPNQPGDQPGKGKPEGDNKNADAKPAEGKDGGKPDMMNPEQKPGEAKDKGKDEGKPEQEPAQAKDGGQNDPNAEKQPAGEAKKPPEKQDPNKESAKGEGKKDEMNPPAEGKDKGKTEGEPAQAKDEGKEPKDPEDKNGKGKDAGKELAKGEGKDDPDKKGKGMTPDEKKKAESVIQQGDQIAKEFKDKIDPKELEDPKNQPDPLDPRAKEKVTDLVLRNLYELEKEGKLDKEGMKEKLKELGFTEEQFKQLLEDYNNLQKDGVVKYLRNEAEAKHVGGVPIKNIGTGPGGPTIVGQPIKAPKELNSAEDEFRKLIGPRP